MAEKWENNDSLREMTSKFNKMVEELETLKSSSSGISEELQTKIDNFTKEVTETMNQTTEKVMSDLSGMTEELAKKLESETDDGLELDDTDLNLSDLNRPVSIPQQEAINAAKNEVLAITEQKLTSIEIGQEIIPSDDPEVSQPVKDYVSKKIVETLAGRDTKAMVVDNKLVINSPLMGIVGYEISSGVNLGVVKASTQVEVDPETGKMFVPQLDTLSNRIEQVNNTLYPLLKQTIKGLQAVARDVGNLQSLKTNNKQDLVSAINELVRISNIL